MYQFKEEINYCNYFRFDKNLIRNKNWALLTKAGKAVYPVICSHSDSKGNAYPSEETISCLTGLSPKQVRKGVNDLCGFPGFEIGYYLSRRGRRAKKYKIDLPPMEKGRCISFNKSILECGNWRMLKPTGKALYPVMRYFSVWEFYDCMPEDDPGESYYGTNDDMAVYKNRKWEICNAEKNILAEYAGIHKTSIKPALGDLIDNYLITDKGDDCYNNTVWNVYIKPEKYYKRSFLNEDIRKQFNFKK